MTRALLGSPPENRSSIEYQMTRRNWLTCLAALSVLCVVGYVAYIAGMNEANARSAYVASVFVQEEHKCFESSDLECLRASWQIRAGSAATLALSAMQRPRFSSVEPELRAYVRWTESLPPHHPPQR